MHQLTVNKYFEQFEEEVACTMNIIKSIEIEEERELISLYNNNNKVDQSVIIKIKKNSIEKKIYLLKGVIGLQNIIVIDIDVVSLINKHSKNPKVTNNTLQEIGRGSNKIIYQYGQYAIGHLRHNNGNYIYNLLKEIITLKYLQNLGFNTTVIIDIIQSDEEIYVIYIYINAIYTTTSCNILYLLTKKSNDTKKISKKIKYTIFKNITNIIDKIEKYKIFGYDTELLIDKNGMVFLHDTASLQIRYIDNTIKELKYLLLNFSTKENIRNSTMPYQSN